MLPNDPAAVYSCRPDATLLNSCLISSAGESVGIPRSQLKSHLFYLCKQQHVKQRGMVLQIIYYSHVAEVAALLQNELQVLYGHKVSLWISWWARLTFGNFSRHHFGKLRWLIRPEVQSIFSSILHLFVREDICVPLVIQFWVCEFFWLVVSAIALQMWKIKYCWQNAVHIARLRPEDAVHMSIYI